MGFPDRIERTVELPHSPGKVWAALTTAEGLSAWFGHDAAIDPRPGGAGWMTWDSGFRVEMRVERVAEPAPAGGSPRIGIFGFTWQILELPEDDPRRTYVEFTLEPAGAGTRLTVVETGFAQLPADVHGKTYDSHVQGWASELGELAEHLDAA
ncbi:MAG TPA: SRPBCC domain-containing protein [Streptosporangiaceae bacterium]|nr:SRPBCC domain-containing protein [Streptosporangiaceae bacterium]